MADGKAMISFIVRNAISATLSMYVKVETVNDSFRGHIFDVKRMSNTTVVRHFASHMNPRITIHILEYKITEEHAQVTLSQTKGELGSRFTD